jgi:hypothetical protein
VPVHGLGRVAILPAYLTTLLTTIGGVSLFGAGEPMPGWYLAASIPLRLAPFLAADYLLARVRRRRGADRGGASQRRVGVG